MILLYIKFTVIFIAVGFKFVTKMITFNMRDYYIKNTMESGLLSLIIIVLQLIITTTYILIIKKYFMDVSQKEAFFSQVIICLLQLFLVLIVAIFRKESISSLGITKKQYT